MILGIAAIMLLGLAEPLAAQGVAGARSANVKHWGFSITRRSESPRPRSTEDAARRAQNRSASRELALRTRELRESLLANSELLAAHEASHRARLRFESARQSVRARLESDDTFRAARARVFQAEDRLQALHADEKATREEIFAAAQSLLHQRMIVSRLLEDAIHQDDETARARYDMIDAHARYLDLRDRLLDELRSDPGLQALRDRMRNRG
ncbi:MAG TPA: hypothetical protein PKB10_08535 [Tepidisphaeraceae bacterium]|nr:hypothetical protein [Tepidisphaeraceae bacterium]